MKNSISYQAIIIPFQGKFISDLYLFLLLLLCLQIPSFVTTKILAVPLSSFFIPTPEVYSKSCLRWIGYEPLCIPYWRHSLQGTIVDALPEALMNWMTLQYVMHLRRMENFKGDSQMADKPPSNGLELNQELGMAQIAFRRVTSMFLGPWYRFGQSSGPVAKQAGALFWK